MRLRNCRPACCACRAHEPGLGGCHQYSLFSSGQPRTDALSHSCCHGQGKLLSNGAMPRHVAVVATCVFGTSRGLVDAVPSRHWPLGSHSPQAHAGCATQGCSHKCIQAKAGFSAAAWCCCHTAGAQAARAWGPAWQAW